MSMYNQMFGFNPLAKPLLVSLGIHPLHIPRFRDCFLLDGKIAVYTRTGGDNRNINKTPWVFEGAIIERTVAPADWNAMCAAHDDYLGTDDDEYDSTYAFWWFSYPAEVAEELAKLAKTHSAERPSARWKKLMARMGRKQ